MLDTIARRTGIQYIIIWRPSFCYAVLLVVYGEGISCKVGKANSRGVEIKSSSIDDSS